MKLFQGKHVSPVEEGYQILVDDLRKTTLELKNTYNNLANVVDPDLIDYYIYHAKAMQIRHKYLMEHIKKLDNHYTIT